jgi:exosome complex exonuclease DIS3/RRP44
MPNSLSFFRRTRKGKVLRIVKDQYLRDDVGCGTFMGRTLGNEDLARLVQDTCTSNPKKVLVVDTNVVLAQMDLLERGDDAITCVMVLQTVLQETRHRNLSLHRRLMELLKEEGRGFVYLANEHHGEMVIEKEDGESPNDMNDRAIRTAALWLQGQLSALDVTVILLSDDRMNVERAGKETLNAMSVQQLVTSLAGTHPGLQDLVALNEEGDAGDWSSSMEQVKEHLPMSELMAGIKSGKFHRGVLRAGRSWANGYVLVEGLGGEDRISVLIEGPRNVNRAMDGDVVAIEILLEAEAAKQIAANSNVSEEREADALDVLVPDLTLPPPLPTSAEQEQSGTGTLQPRGRVVGIVRRNSKPLCGTLDVSGDREAAGGVAVRALFVPLDKKLPKVRITTRQRGSLSHKRIVVMVDSWPAQSRYPIGHYVRSLGEVGDKATETEVILLEHDIAHEPFSQKVIACLPPTDWTITEENSRGRTDLRHLPVMSIDPPGCKDIDDALHSRSLPNGNIEVGVHIADVTYYVEAGSPLDDEAAARSTSTYLVDKRLDMLPKLLTETLCSLRSNVDRFAFSIVWELSPAGDIVDVAFFKSIIHSVGAFTYDEAQAMLDDPAAGSDICKSVKQLNVIAKLLRKRRMDAGALTLASPEVKFVLDSESQNPTDVQVYSLKDANALVEEFMLLANITVSKKILRHFPTLSVLRRHPSPSLKQFENLLLLAESAGVKLDVTDSKRLSHSLDGAVNEQDPYFNRLMRILTTRQEIQFVGLGFPVSLTFLICALTICCHYSHQVHDSGPIFLLWGQVSGRVAPLWTSHAYLHPLHQPHQEIRRCACAPIALGCNWGCTNAIISYG